jgi:hypothetical protein
MFLGNVDSYKEPHSLPTLESSIPHCYRRENTRSYIVVLG